MQWRHDRGHCEREWGLTFSNQPLLSSNWKNEIVFVSKIYSVDIRCWSILKLEVVSVSRICLFIPKGVGQVASSSSFAHFIVSLHTS